MIWCICNCAYLNKRKLSVDQRVVLCILRELNEMKNEKICCLIFHYVEDKEINLKCDYFGCLNKLLAMCACV